MDTHRVKSLSKKSFKDFQTNLLLLNPTKYTKVKIKNEFYTSSKGFSNYFYDIEKLTKGKFGTIYKACHKMSMHYYAIKKIPMLSSHEKDDYLVEPRIMVKLNHVNIVGFNTCWIETASENDLKCKSTGSSSSYTNNIEPPVSVLYIQTELCNRSLQSFLDSKNDKNISLPSQMTYSIASQILHGLSHIHQCNIIHHDIRPENIAISTETKRLRVLIGNFTLACCSSINPNHSKNFGSMIYAPPEEELTNQACTFKTDIFSFGILLLELLHSVKTKQELYLLKKDIIENEFSPQLYQELFNKHNTWAEVLVKSLRIDAASRPACTELKEIVWKMFFQEIKHKKN